MVENRRALSHLFIHPSKQIRKTLEIMQYLSEAISRDCCSIPITVARRLRVLSTLSQAVTLKEREMMPAVDVSDA